MYCNMFDYWTNLVGFLLLKSSIAWSLVISLSRSRVRVPRGIAMVITSLQLIQMVVGCLVNVWAYQVNTRARSLIILSAKLKLSNCVLSNQ